MHTIYTCADGVISSGNGSVRVNNSKMEAIATIETGKASARGVMLRGKTLVMATNQAELLLVGDYTQATTTELLAMGHHDGVCVGGVWVCGCVGVCVCVLCFCMRCDVLFVMCLRCGVLYDTSYIWD